MLIKVQLKNHKNNQKGSIAKWKLTKFSSPHLIAVTQKGPMKASTAFIKPFKGTTKKNENKNSRQLSLDVRDLDRIG